MNNILKKVLTIRKAYSNWLSVGIRLIFRSKVDRLIMRDGSKFDQRLLSFGNRANNFAYKYAVLKENGWKLQSEYPYLRISKSVVSFPGNYISLEAMPYNLSGIVEIFEDCIYGKDFSNKVVIDIGMNIADSSIFFSVCGAKLVIGIEPVDETYRLAIQNIKSNNLSERILPINAALSLNEARFEMKISKFDSGIAAGVESAALKSKKILSSLNESYIAVGVTLPRILIDNKIQKIDFMKMDCEGCEYALLKGWGQDLFDKIEEIVLEFHDRGPEDLLSTLSKRGFVCRSVGKRTGLIWAVKTSNTHAQTL